MNKIYNKLFFDQRDYILISIVNDVLEKKKSKTSSKKRFFSYLHPHGIKEISESKGLRIAYAVIHLLHSIDAGEVGMRLKALRTLRDEVLYSPESTLQKNTARVLIQIMKDIVRSLGNYQKQLELAHDFRMATSGKPRIIRNLLKRYHLLEMSENWNQVAFDDHVHDANTKGRKNSTHLIMDAWIKGIRRLRVIYYNYIQPSFAAELLEAAELMEITVRIGIEFSAKFRNKYIQLIWVPRGFSDAQALLCFLAEDQITNFMEEGKKVSAHERQWVIDRLLDFNIKHLEPINHAFGIQLSPIEPITFMNFVGQGQASLIHLADFIHTILHDAFENRVEEIKKTYSTLTSDAQNQAITLINNMNQIDIAYILETYLENNQELNSIQPDQVACDPDCPALLKLAPTELINTLTKIHWSFRLTLNLTNLDVEDVLEILYDCEGRISRLELFNLKDYVSGKIDHIQKIHELQQALNQSNVIHLKKSIGDAIDHLAESDITDKVERIEKLHNILYDITAFKDMYKDSLLESRIGSDSTGRSPRIPGMGLVITETLPPNAQKELKDLSDSQKFIVPVHINTKLRMTFSPPEDDEPVRNFFSRCAKFFFSFSFLGYHKKIEWIADESSTQLTPKGNIVTLGGMQKKLSNIFSLDPSNNKKKFPIKYKYLNTLLKNSLKVIFGFIPAFFTFALMYDWWVLAYCGAFIWFGITGLRNIVQSILGGGGIIRSSLLKWNNFVSWERLTDSLLFTGFSVPLLDYFTKTLVLNKSLGITTTTHPILLYSVMAIINGIYLFSHNIFRGLPKQAAIGNFFRSVLSIPIAIGFNMLLGGVLGALDIADINNILQKWAAVISKAASDCMAGIIEGTADRTHNIRMRIRDYENKFQQLIDIYSELELLFSDAQALEIVRNPEKFLNSSIAEAQDIKKAIIINALDLMYFWMYQPRAQTVFKSLLKNMTPEEKEILIQTQFILLLQKEISLLFIDGIIGKNFSKSLSFYLERSKQYLQHIQKIAQMHHLDTKVLDKYLNIKHSYN